MVKPTNQISMMAQWSTSNNHPSNPQQPIHSVRWTPRRFHGRELLAPGGAHEGPSSLDGNGGTLGEIWVIFDWGNHGKTMEKWGNHRKIMGKLRTNMGKIGELRYLNRNIRWKHWTFTGSHEKNHGKSLDTGKRMGYWTQDCDKGCELLWMSVSYCYEMVHG